MKSFLMIGQSNMAGRGFLNEAPPIYNERIEMLRNGRWQMMTEPVNFDRPVAGISLASSFAESWCRVNLEEKIGLIPCAEGGSMIDEWAPDGILFRHAVSEAGFAMENSELAGVLWHQGESDSDSGKYKTYYGKLSRIVERLRKELNAPDIPFIIGGLGDYLGKTAFGLGCVEYGLINQELMRFAEENENCYFVTAQGLASNPDGIHINARSQRIFGLRYFEAYHGKQHVYHPLKDEEKLAGACHNRENTPAEKVYMALENFTRGKIPYEKLMEVFAQGQK